MPTPFDLKDDSVVVIVGSGAGGGTLANQLAKKGHRHGGAGSRQALRARGARRDEWPAFRQLAWLDMRTASGTWRLAKDFPNLPAWHSKCVGGSPVQQIVPW